jgi:hypothetical protein
MGNHLLQPPQPNCHPPSQSRPSPVLQTIQQQPKNARKRREFKIGLDKELTVNPTCHASQCNHNYSNSHKGQRMKSRLSELEARLDQHERNKPKATENEPYPPNSRLSDSLVGIQRLKTPVGAESQSPEPVDKPAAKSQMLQPNFYNPAIDESDEAGFMQNAPQMNNNPSPSRPLSQSRSLSQSRPPCLDDRPDRTGKMYDKLILDHLCLPKQLLDKTNNQIEKPNVFRNGSERDNATPGKWEEKPHMRRP